MILAGRFLFEDKSYDYRYLPIDCKRPNKQITTQGGSTFLRSYQLM